LLEHLESVMERRWQRLHDADASSGRAAFRWVHREADGVPGLALDVYGDHVVMHVYEVERTGAAQELADEIVQMGFAGVYLKRRPLRANELGGEERSVVAPSDPLAGEAAEDVEVCENGVTYQVALGDGLSTGLFLDQRRNRRRLMSLAEGSSILNLFAYTGAFSVAAAHAGARETVSVDASRRALDRAERMLESFGEGHRVVKADVFRFLESSKDFDVVIVDPPTHSTVEGNRWRSGAEWTELASQCARRVASSGWLVACSNDSRMTGGTFTRRLEEGVHAAGRVIEEIDHELPEGDFPPHPSRGCHLKSVWMRLR
jgi:23S rRNA (cytosine1962-C5)-methyltransferase